MKRGGRGVKELKEIHSLNGNIATAFKIGAVAPQSAHSLLNIMFGDELTIILN